MPKGQLGTYIQGEVPASGTHVPAGTWHGKRWIYPLPHPAEGIPEHLLTSIFQPAAVAITHFAHCGEALSSALSSPPFTPYSM